MGVYGQANEYAQRWIFIIYTNISDCLSVCSEWGADSPAAVMSERGVRLTYWTEMSWSFRVPCLAKILLFANHQREFKEFSAQNQFVEEQSAICSLIII